MGKGRAFLVVESVGVNVWRSKGIGVFEEIVIWCREVEELGV